ncbi:MAG: helix-turn-helix domain-containing protein [Propionibacteriaceae bacterium]|nr:helix-turn-helix domain-containing protein [Propionibacteriaceae bacterium]
MPPDDGNSRDSSPRSVLGRTLDILDCFGRDNTIQSVAGICRATGLPPATVHRILASLVEWGAVDRVDRGRYQLGERIWRLGHWVPDIRQLRDVARPHLVDLHDDLRAPLVMAGLDGERVFAIDRIAGRAHHRIWPYRVTYGVLQHAAGLVFMTWGARSLPAKQAIEPTHDLRRLLATIKQRGCAEATLDGARWLAAPVFHEARQVRAAICVALTSDTATEQAASQLVRAAAAISAELTQLRMREQ